MRATSPELAQLRKEAKQGICASCGKTPSDGRGSDWYGMFVCRGACSNRAFYLLHRCYDTSIRGRLRSPAELARLFVRCRNLSLWVDDAHKECAAECLVGRAEEWFSRLPIGVRFQAVAENWPVQVVFALASTKDGINLH